MTTHEYTIVLMPEPDGSAYNVTVPALPGVFTFGATVEEALDMVREAIAVHLAGLVKDGEPIPEETRAVQIARVRVAA